MSATSIAAWCWKIKWCSDRSTPNRRHYRAAAEALAKADKNWLGRLITRRVPLARWREAFEQRPGDIKVVVDFSEA